MQTDVPGGLPGGGIRTLAALGVVAAIGAGIALLATAPLREGGDLAAVTPDPGSAAPAGAAGDREAAAASGDRDGSERAAAGDDGMERAAAAGGDERERAAAAGGDDGERAAAAGGDDGMDRAAGRDDGTEAAAGRAGPAEESAAADGAAAADGEADPDAPRFEVVRVGPDGAALVAGRAPPGAAVSVLVGEETLAEVEADATGEFVAIFRAPPAREPRALVLESAGAAGTLRSAETVLLLPPAPAAGETGGRTAAASSGGEAVSAPQAGAPAQTPAGAPVEMLAGTPAEGEPVVAATAIVSPEGVEATPTEPPPPGGRRSVSLASIAYSEEGLVTLAGYAAGGARVRVYVDGAHAEDAEADPEGRWKLELGEIAGGVYTLRVDELRGDGTVASRVETPFQRDFPALDAGAEAAPSVTVQPGANLWTLARQHYGQGVLYTQIFTANAELIADPDLIYPGQIFRLPQVEGLASTTVEGPRARP